MPLLHGTRQLMYHHHFLLTIHLCHKDNRSRFVCLIEKNTFNNDKSKFPFNMIEISLFSATEMLTVITV